MRCLLLVQDFGDCCRCGGFAADADLVEIELPHKNVPIHRHIVLIQRSIQVRLYTELGTFPGNDKKRHWCFIVAENRHTRGHLGI